LTATYGDYPFWPIIPFTPNRMDILETDKLEYWENIAVQAVEFFSSKEDFMEWVCTHYFADDNRRTADGAWDLVKYMQDNPEMDVD
jgi:hypothetical protein